MNNLKLSSMGIWISVGDDYAIKLASSGAAPSSAFCGQNPRTELAKRIVACVNACDGVPTDVLENTVQRGGALMYQQDRRKAAESQRDELLAALESLVLFTNPKPSNAVALNNAHRVIARAKGDSPPVDRLAWLESMHTLHGAVEVLYVVDGYQLTLTYDDLNVGEPVHGATLAEAIDNAIAAGWKPLTKGVYV